MADNRITNTVWEVCIQALHINCEYHKFTVVRIEDLFLVEFDSILHMLIRKYWLCYVRNPLHLDWFIPAFVLLRYPHIKKDHLIKLLKQLLASNTIPSLHGMIGGNTPNAADVPTLLGSGSLSLLDCKYCVCFVFWVLTLGAMVGHTSIIEGCGCTGWNLYEFCLYSL